ncbi:VRR-NUC domain-containing protein [Roseovarius sp. SYSU LYC5161]|uniref:VRR-NUC domain-containing protein n=1 Tax=Roseovarius halophilus (ex Wu et al. 2025) TaxID=3376060 RepID=UPI00399A8AFC
MTDRMTAEGLRAYRAAEGDTRAPKSDREGPVHRAILQYLRHALPADALVHHSPNELDMAGSEAARQIAKARKMGTRAGWPDLEIIWCGRAYMLEVKAPRGRQSPDQRAVANDLERAGAEYAVVRSIEEVQHVISKWGMK